jgi:hypothetical protein
VNRRTNCTFHWLARYRTPLLVTTVDGEESFDWTRPLTRNLSDLAAIGQQYLAHEIFDRHNVVPAYLMTYPVVAKDDGYRPLLELFQSGKCEIGAQLHPWVTLPYDEVVNSQNSFAGNLPASLEFEKLRVLTEVIAQRIAQRPHVYRAGRYGLGPNTYSALRLLGYQIDSSVVSEQNFSAQSGPSFFDMPVLPYWTDAQQSLLEIPLTSAFVGPLGMSAKWIAHLLYSNNDHYRIVRSALARIGALEHVRLTPEGTNVTDAKRLVRALLGKRINMFVISYHAPSLLAGNTPYVQSIADRDRLLRWLDEFYEYFFGDLGGAAATMAGLYEIATQHKTKSAR